LGTIAMMQTRLSDLASQLQELSELHEARGAIGQSAPTRELHRSSNSFATERRQATDQGEREQTRDGGTGYDSQQQPEPAGPRCSTGRDTLGQAGKLPAANSTDLEGPQKDQEHPNRGQEDRQGRPDADHHGQWWEAESDLEGSACGEPEWGEMQHITRSARQLQHCFEEYLGIPSARAQDLAGQACPDLVRLAVDIAAKQDWDPMALWMSVAILETNEWPDGMRSPRTRAGAIEAILPQLHLCVHQQFESVLAHSTSRADRHRRTMSAAQLYREYVRDQLAQISS
jgi:hypothetical protein